MTLSALRSTRSVILSAVVIGFAALVAFALTTGAGPANAQTADATPTAESSAITPTETAASETPTATAATGTTSSSGEFAADQAVIVDAHMLNFRASASIDAEINAQLLNGTWATVVSGPVDAGDGHAWYEINVNDVTGWVDGAYLIDAGSDGAAIPAGAVVAVTSDTVNFRSDPSTSATVLSKLASGDTGTVVGGPQTADGHTWLQLDVNGVTGWAAREFLAFAPANVASAAAGDSVLVNTNFLVVRDAPSTTGTRLDHFAGGTTLTIVSGPTTSDDGDWYEVTDGTITGWVSADYLRAA